MTSTNSSPVDTGTSRVAFRTDIQGLRAVAVLLVLVYHAEIFGLTGGYIGVDVFFVISGYLITNHLVSQLERHGRINFASFYARRVRRILPASFAVLILSAAACVMFLPPVLKESNLWDAVWTALYVPNIAYAVDGTDYLAETSPSVFQHYWSLGVEEQFYLLWPIALLALWFASRRSRRVLQILVGLLIAVSLILAIWLTYKSQPWAFFSLPSRAWELGLGGLVALIGANSVDRIPRALRSALTWVSLAVVIAAGFVYSDLTLFPGFSALLPVVATATIIYLGQRPAFLNVGLVLNTRPLQFLGRISYTLYLVHWPLLVIPALANGAPLSPLTNALLAIASVPIAWLLTILVEDPARLNPTLAKIKSKWVLYGALAASSISVMALVAGVFVISNAPLHSDKPADAVSDGPSEIVSATEFSDFVPNNLAPSLADVAADIPSTYGDGCHLSASETHVQSCSYGDVSSTTTMALFGDSHAAQWFPALERIASEQGIRLDNYTKSSCPSVDVPITVKTAPYEECGTWRHDVIEYLVANPPSIIVLSNMADQPGQPNGGIDPEDWSAGLSRVIERLPNVEIVVITDTPRFAETPAICLSAHLNDSYACSVNRTDAVDGEWRDIESVAATQAGGDVINLNDYICSPDICGMILGANLIYRDAHHLTATYAAHLSTPLWGKLKPLINASLD